MQNTALSPPALPPPGQETKNPALGSGPGSGLLNSESHSTRRPRKWARVLRAMLNGRSLNRFEATRELSDWCLHSTVAKLQGKGVLIHRRDETVPGFHGIPTHVTRYWLAPQSRERAAELLGEIVP